MSRGGSILASGEGYLLVVSAYRDNEVDALHPLSLALSELKKDGAIIGDVKLEALGVSQVEQFLADALGAGLSRVEPLAALLSRRSGGNPFFLGQFLTSLHKDGLLRFDPRTRAWSWEIERVAEAMVTDNVVEFMVNKLRRLSPATQHALRMGACIGYLFDPGTLAVICEQTLAEVTAHLQEALEEGLVVCLTEGPSYRFLHDRVQQAAYALIEPSRQQEAHLRIGRLLMAGRVHDDQLFDVVKHMNRGAALIVDGDERRALGRLNAAAGRRARDAADYSTARTLLTMSAELLGEDSWERDYDVAYATHLVMAECAFVGGHHDEAFELLDGVERHAKSPLDAASASWLRAQILTTMMRLQEALACGIEAARRIGMDFPPLDTDLGPIIGSEQRALEEALAGVQIESLIDLPVMSDFEGNELLRILYGITPAANQVAPQVLVLIVVKALALALRGGNSPFTSYFYVAYGLVLASSGDSTPAIASESSASGSTSASATARWTAAIASSSRPSSPRGAGTSRRASRSYGWG